MKPEIKNQLNFLRSALPWKGSYDCNYEGRPRIEKLPLGFPLFPWQKTLGSYHAIVEKSDLGVPVAIPLMLENPDPETKANLQRLLEHSRNGDQIYLRGRNIVRVDGPDNIGSLLKDSLEVWVNLLTLKGFHHIARREVYSGTIEVNGAPTFQYYVDMSPQMRRGGISQIAALG
ncbi:hypothetical protein HYU20_02600 [Candidatus Woesearchaeota archaeon]|nr:hypothetical protein [Candidatus Woesearchaeota archaeon]